MYNISVLDLIDKYNDFTISKHKNIYSVSIYINCVAYSGRNETLSMAIHEAISLFNRRSLLNE